MLLSTRDLDILSSLSEMFFTSFFVAVTEGVQRYKGANLPPDKINAKTEPPFAYISIFSTFLVYSKLLFFAFFESFWTVIFR